MTDTNKTSGAKCAHNWHDSSDKPGTVRCNRCKMVSAAGSEGVPYVAPSGADVLAVMVAAAHELDPFSRSVNRAEREREIGQKLDKARTAVAALIERNAELEARASSTTEALNGMHADLREIKAGLTNLIAERDALAAEVKALREDAERYRHSFVMPDASHGGLIYVVGEEIAPRVYGKIATKEKATIDSLIDAARASAATGGGNG